MSKKRRIAVWIGRILTAAVFIMAGAHKLGGDVMMVAMFDKIGLGQGLRYITGALEITAAALLLWPRSSLGGALLGLCVVTGAFLTQLLILHGDVIHTLVIGSVLFALVWHQMPSLRRPAM